MYFVEAPFGDGIYFERKITNHGYERREILRQMRVIEWY